MDTLNDIGQKLLSGSTVNQLIKESYAKSSINHAARKLKKNQEPGTTVTQIDNELQEIRHQKEIMKLQKEIAELEVAKEKMPDRLAKLEAEVYRLNKELSNLVGECYASVYSIILQNYRWNEDETRQEAISAANKFLKHFGY